MNIKILLLKTHQPADEDAEEEEDDDGRATQPTVFPYFENQIEKSEGHNGDDHQFHEQREDDVKRTAPVSDD